MADKLRKSMRSELAEFSSLQMDVPYLDVRKGSQTFRNLLLLFFLAFHVRNFVLFANTNSLLKNNDYNHCAERSIFAFEHFHIDIQLTKANDCILWPLVAWIVIYSHEIWHTK